MTTLPDALRHHLRLPLPGEPAQQRMAPRPRTPLEPSVTLDDLSPAAVLILLYEHHGAWHLPLTLRGSRLRHHTGQVSLPGGRIDPGESAEQAALREAYEEIGVSTSDVEVLGRLTPLSIAVSGHRLHPVVGVVPARPQFVIAEYEVERIIEAPIDHLLAPRAVGLEFRVRSRPALGEMEVPYFDVDGVHVWGATAMVLAEFLAVVERIGPDLTSAVVR